MLCFKTLLWTKAKFSTASYIRSLVSSNSVRLSIVTDGVNVILTNLKKFKPIISPLPIFTELPHPNLEIFFCLRYRLTALMLFVYIWTAAKEARQIGKIYINTFFLLVLEKIKKYWNSLWDKAWSSGFGELLVCPKLTIHQFFIDQVCKI